jgi:hypothetical protein
MHGIRGALSRWVYHATEALTMEMPVTRVLAIEHYSKPQLIEKKNNPRVAL